MAGFEFNLKKERERKKKSTHDGTRTRNLFLRREAPYPLGHASRLLSLLALSI